MSDAPINEEALLDIVDGDRTFLKRLVKTFLDDCSSYMDAIRTAVEENDADTLAQEAHGLKGAVANLQAQPAREAARRLEDIGQSGDLSEAQDVLETLEDEIDRLKSTLVDLIE